MKIAECAKPLYFSVSVSAKIPFFYFSLLLPGEDIGINNDDNMNQKLLKICNDYIAFLTGLFPSSFLTLQGILMSLKATPTYCLVPRPVCARSLAT